MCANVGCISIEEAVKREIPVILLFAVTEADGLIILLRKPVWPSTSRGRATVDVERRHYMCHPHWVIAVFCLYYCYLKYSMVDSYMQPLTY